MHLASAHLCDCDYEERNPGLGYTRTGWDGPGDGWTVGVYENSIGRTSAYAGALWRWRDSRVIVPEVGVGVVTGYEGGPHPAVIPRVRLRPAGAASLVLTAMPAKDAAVGVSVGWRW